jgi:hypothetical protein
MTFPNSGTDVEERANGFCEPQVKMIPVPRNNGVNHLLTKAREEVSVGIRSLVGRVVRNVDKTVETKSLREKK